MESLVPPHKRTAVYWAAMKKIELQGLGERLTSVSLLWPLLILIVSGQMRDQVPQPSSTPQTITDGLVCSGDLE